MSWRLEKLSGPIRLEPRHKSELKQPRFLLGYDPGSLSIESKGHQDMVSNANRQVEQFNFV